MLVQGQQATFNALGHRVTTSTTSIHSSHILKYPMLYPHSKNSFNYSKLSQLIKDLTIEGNDVQSLELFWHLIKSALCSSLSAPLVLSNYRDLDLKYDITFE